MLDLIGIKCLFQNAPKGSNEIRNVLTPSNTQVEPDQILVHTLNHMCACQGGVNELNEYFSQRCQHNKLEIQQKNATIQNHCKVES